MILRPDYIEAVKPFMDAPLVKILTGVRRCGKSTIFEMIRQELLERGIPEDHIVMKKYTDQQLQDKLNRYFLRYCEDLDKKGVEIIQNDVKIDTGSKEGAISGTLTIICNTGQSRQSEIPQLPNDPEEQIEQLGE